MAIVTFYNCDPKDAPKTTMPAHLGSNAILTWNGKLLLEKRRDSDIWELKNILSSKKWEVKLKAWSKPMGSLRAGQLSNYTTTTKKN